MTTEITKEGLDLVMVPTCGEWLCSIYRTGKQIPLQRKLIASQEKAVAWFDRFISKEGK